MESKIYNIDGLFILEVYDGNVYEYYFKISGYPFQFSFGVEKKFSKRKLINLVRNGYFHFCWEE